MTQRSKSAFATLYGSSGSLFPDNTSGAIGEEDIRAQGEDIKDSFVNKTDEAYVGVKGFKNSINTIANLQAVTTVGTSVPYYTAFRHTANENVLRAYELVTGTDSESVPDIIRPTDYAGTTNEKVWKLAYTNTTTLGTNEGSIFKPPVSFIVGALSKTTAIETAAVLTGSSVPVNVTPDPDAGYMVIPIMYFIQLDYNSAAYATNTTFRFEINGVAVSATNSTILPGTADRVTMMFPVEYDTTTSLNGHPVKFEIQGGDPTAGNSPLYITTIYKIVSLYPIA